MPCDIGYKNSADITFRKGEKELQSETEAPKVDAELLELIGEKDKAFVEWLDDVDIYPLLAGALRKTLDALPDSDFLSFEISKNGKLKSSGSYANELEKRALERINNEVFARFEMEVLKTILELLGYETIIYTENGDIVIEGEKQGLARVNKYTRITRKSGGLSLRFEHFESVEDIKDERNKFFALSQKLGLKVDITDGDITGEPIPPGVIHEHFLKEKE